MIDRTERRLRLKPRRLAPESAYGSAATLNWIVNKKKIAPHIPVIDMSKCEDGTYSQRFPYSRPEKATKRRSKIGTHERESPRPGVPRTL